MELRKTMKILSVNRRSLAEVLHPRASFVFMACCLIKNRGTFNTTLRTLAASPLSGESTVCYSWHDLKTQSGADKLLMVWNREHTVARMWRLYETGIGLTTGFIGSHTVTHNYSVYTLQPSLLQLQLTHNSFWISSGPRTSCRSNWLLLAIN
jgi:hypothetical protein